MSSPFTVSRDVHNDLLSVSRDRKGYASAYIPKSSFSPERLADAWAAATAA